VFRLFLNKRLHSSDFPLNSWSVLEALVRFPWRRLIGFLEVRYSRFSLFLHYRRNPWFGHYLRLWLWIKLLLQPFAKGRKGFRGIIIYLVFGHNLSTARRFRFFDNTKNHNADHYKKI